MERGWKPNVEISPPCPRCGSTNTKFCYYNNYSLTQPRYFCKGCRRYWTKGGSLRNVPVGGGCRKSRRGKPFRTSTDCITSRGGGTALSDHNGSPVLPALATGRADGPNIDLALVYANFLNPKPSEPPEPEPEPDPAGFLYTAGDGTWSESRTSHLLSKPEPRLEVVPELANGVGPSFRFSCIETMHMDMSTADQLAQESVYLGGLDSYEKEQFGDHQFMNSMNHMNNNYILPPLPGEETVPEGLVWPSNSGLMCPSHQAVQSAGVLPQGQAMDSNRLDENGSFFHIPNYGIFSGLDK